jgi:uncharacterized protein (TIGR03643 family)
MQINHLQRLVSNSGEQIRALHGLGPNEVQALMKRELKRGSYVAWRKRVRAFTQRRAFYK